MSGPGGPAAELVLHSRGDLRVPESQAQELAALIPGSRLCFLNSRNDILTAAEPASPGFLAELARFPAQGEARLW